MNLIGLRPNQFFYFAFKNAHTHTQVNEIFKEEYTYVSITEDPRKNCLNTHTTPDIHEQIVVEPSLRKF